jgi:serine/threonine-protein kinase
MGAVFRAQHRSILGKFAAVKVIHELFRFDAKRIARFQFEALAALRLSHPGIVSVITLAEWDGLQVIVQGLVDGERSHTARVVLARELRGFVQVIGQHSLARAS